MNNGILEERKLSGSERKLKVLLRDCTQGFYQQMYFFGKDVSHQKGNYLGKYGFRKTPSQGLKGTSCYTLHAESYIIELYGSCAGMYREAENIVFLRDRNRFYKWLSPERCVAGRWNSDQILSQSPTEMFSMMKPFLEWWLEYERWIISELGIDYRNQCHHAWSKIKVRKHWLMPAQAIQWVEAFLEKKEHQTRARNFT